ncbi:MAG: hypothetical protein PF489_13495 [Salinivirgaceae bacterium]|nr:hypothetical protein [Salinivirgaceae bacterium]
MIKELTENEKKIIKALNRLDKLWAEYGEGLWLFNGNSLRKGNGSIDYEIAFFPNIGEGGGDGGDSF